MDNKRYYVGSCPHDIDEDFYNSDMSTYTIMEATTGAYTSVTTCRECRANHEAEDNVIDPDDIPFEDFNNPFAENPAPDIINLVNLDGSTTVVDLTKKPV